MKSSQSAKGAGDSAEKAAALYLVSKGYSIIERNYHSPYGEIDIIAGIGDWLVFVEVKYRTSGYFGSPASFVDFKKQNKIRKTALYYIGENNIDLDFRFDVIELFGAGEMAVNHIEGAFY